METDHQNYYVSPNSLQFLPYLWGMETPSQARLSSRDSCSYRTYEEWKPFYAARKIAWIKFLPYLWGMETRIIHIFRIANTIVLTVPMRNGNLEEEKVNTAALLSSYRTYEEWKQLFDKIKGERQRVLTVPMRNGNVSLVLLRYRSPR